MTKTLEGDNREDTLEGYIGIQAEASLYYTLTDAHELIQAIGLKDFLESHYNSHLSCNTCIASCSSIVSSLPCFSL